MQACIRPAVSLKQRRRLNEKAIVECQKRGLKAIYAIDSAIKIVADD
jgi:hypothetical protein